VVKSGDFFLLLKSTDKTRTVDQLNRNIRMQGGCQRATDDFIGVQEAIGTSSSRRFCGEKSRISALFGIVSHARMESDDVENQQVEPIQKEEQ
jgi:hypothetical protein